MRPCSHCSVPKEESEFNFRNKLKNQKHTYCKDCGKGFSAAHYKNNPAPYKARSRSRTSNGRQLLLQYLQAHPCVDCEENDPIVLQFDHITGKKIKEISVMAHAGYSWSAILHEIEKCVVRCANCHIRITAKRANTFRYKMVTPKGIEPLSLVS